MGAQAACCCLSRDGDDPRTLDEGIVRVPPVQSEGAPELERIRSAYEAASSRGPWWGIGPATPDRRMEAAMPGHAIVTHVVDVAFFKTGAVKSACEAFPLDKLCVPGGRYLLWRMRFGADSLASLHHIVRGDTFERIFGADGGDPLRDAVKLVVTPVNLKFVPSKGPKEAATIGDFFGPENAAFTRAGEGCGRSDVAVVDVDVFSVLSLKWLLPPLAFREGRICDYHLVSYRDSAVICSYRMRTNAALVRYLRNGDAPLRDEVPN